MPYFREQNPKFYFEIDLVKLGQQQRALSVVFSISCYPFLRLVLKAYTTWSATESVLCDLQT